MAPGTHEQLKNIAGRRERKFGEIAAQQLEQRHEGLVVRGLVNVLWLTITA
jgi:hypothetical protein